MTKCEKIRKHLNDRGIKQKWCADASNIDYTRFRRLMIGRGSLSADECERIENVLGISLKADSLSTIQKDGTKYGEKSL